MGKEVTSRGRVNHRSRGLCWWFREQVPSLGGRRLCLHTTLIFNLDKTVYKQTNKRQNQHKKTLTCGWVFKIHGVGTVRILLSAAELAAGWSALKVLWGSGFSPTHAGALQVVMNKDESGCL